MARSPVRHGTRSILLMALLATTLAACSHSPGKARASAAKTAILGCAHEQLRLQLWHDVGAAMQQASAWFGITNTSNAQCTLRGYPNLGLLDRASQPIDFGSVRTGGGYLVEDPGPHVVLLRPGGRAFFAFNWVDANMAEGGGTQGCRSASFARVNLTDDHVPVTVEAHLKQQICPRAQTSPTSNGLSITAINQALAWIGWANQPPPSPDPGG